MVCTTTVVAAVNEQMVVKHTGATVGKLGGLTFAELSRLSALQQKYQTQNVPRPTGGDGAEGARRNLVNILQNSPEQEEPIWMIDLSTIVNQCQKWRRNFPTVEPFYAVKCNNAPMILDTLNALGCNFDCASKGEIEMVLALGVQPSRIVFANPCKQIAHIKFARDCGVEMTTVDNELELRKLKVHWPQTKVLIRIATDDSAAVCQFSSKFGATLHHAFDLLETARTLGLEVIGVSFHVGSGCGDAQAYVDAAYNAYRVFQRGRELGFEMELLDIGGGFPGDEVSVPSFEQIAAALNPVLETMFIGVRVIAEPGRYFACASHTLAANVYSKRVIGGGEISKIMKNAEVETDWTQAEYQYYINDGLYQSFNCIFYDHAVVKPYHLKMDELFEDESGEQELNFKSTTIFGPTCDSLDCIAKKIPFPEMSIGDWVYFTNMGAYTCAAASSFNGFSDWRTVFTTYVDYGAIKNGIQKGLTEEREEQAVQEK